MENDEEYIEYLVDNGWSFKGKRNDNGVITAAYLHKDYPCVRVEINEYSVVYIRSVESVGELQNDLIKFRKDPKRFD